MPEPLITRYRPLDFDEMVGHEEIRAGLKRRIKSGNPPHGYLLTGPSGVGKTTLARIIAHQLDCEVVEIDAASQNGVDAMRELVELGRHRALSGAGRRMFLLNECFAPGTRVTTPAGTMPIEQIKVGDVVLGAQGPNKVRCAFANPVDLNRIVRLQFHSGKTVIASEDHPFLTTSGWCKAGELNASRRIYKVCNRIPQGLQNLWDTIYDAEVGVLSPLRFMSEGSFNKNLSSVQQDFLWLQDSMLTEMREHAGSAKANRPQTGILEKSGESRNYKFSRDPTRMVAGIGSSEFPTYDCEQSQQNARSYREGQNNQGQEGDLTCLGRPPGRQRTRNDERTSNSTKHSKLSVGIHHSDRLQHFSQNQSELARPLYCRSSVPGHEISDRSRWQGSSLGEQTCSGSSKKFPTELFGLDRIKSIKRGRAALAGTGIRTHTDQYGEFAIFFDLEIENHPSYAVEELLVHNCQRLTRNSWDALLTILEEPPEHLFFAFTTTEKEKIPDAVRTRCFAVDLRALSDREMQDYIELICQLENWKVDNGVFALVVAAATGQPRKALVLLEAVHDVANREEAKRIIQLHDPSDPLIKMCAYLLSGKKEWRDIKQYWLDSYNEDFDEVSTQCARYILGAMVRAETEQKAQLAYKLLDALLIPHATYDKKVAFYAAIGHILWD